MIYGPDESKKRWYDDDNGNTQAGYCSLHPSGDAAPLGRVEGRVGLPMS